MKKYYLGFLLLIPFLMYLKKVNADVIPGFPTQWEIIQIASANVAPAGLGTPQTIALSPAGSSNAGLRPCLVELTWAGENLTAGQTLSILDGQATAYILTVTTFTSGPYIESWPVQFPLCLGANTTGYIQLSTGNYKVNASGFRRTY